MSYLAPPHHHAVNGKAKPDKGAAPATNTKAVPAAAVAVKGGVCEDPADAPKNGTIDDLLLASSIALDTDSTRVSLEEELGGGRASPSTRDAIQGMLSMSKSAFTFGPCDGGGPMGPTAQELLEGGPLSTGLALGLTGGGARRPPLSSTSSLKRPTPFGSASSRLRPGEEEDLEESLLKECHADDDYVYPGLEASDDELRVFKPRGRSKRDEAWNPKAKLAPNCPKPPRPTREGTQKKSVKRTIEDTASKLANKPPPKRSYHRKKVQAPPKAKEKEVEDYEAGPSTSAAAAAVAASKKPSLPPDAFRLKKPKKGFADRKSVV